MSAAYLKGVDEFLDFAFVNVVRNGKILCPCVDCNNCVWKDREDVRANVVIQGFLKSYTNWIEHGETWLHDESTSYPCDDMQGLLHDATGIPILNDETTHEQREEISADASEFFRLMKDVE